ncbi:MAG: hypothetical protein Q4F05_19125 [bacterium]|nr:hypothetical protein [bacterium]
MNLFFIFILEYLVLLGIILGLKVMEFYKGKKTSNFDGLFGVIIGYVIIQYVCGVNEFTKENIQALCFAYEIIYCIYYFCLKLIHFKMKEKKKNMDTQ